MILLEGIIKPAARLLKHFALAVVRIVERYFNILK